MAEISVIYYNVENMKLTLHIIALTFILAYLAEIKISFYPFSISFNRGWLALGFLFISMGLACLRYQWRGDGLKRGAEIMKEVIEETKQEEIKRSI